MKWIVACMLLLLPITTFAAGDPVHGAKVFLNCAPCHNLDKPESRVGPTLFEIVGRKAAAVVDFLYSPVMRQAGSNGLVWDEGKLGEFLKAPKSLYPGNKMAFSGLKSQQDIDDLIADLKEH